MQGPQVLCAMLRPGPTGPATAGIRVHTAPPRSNTRSLFPKIKSVTPFKICEEIVMGAKTPSSVYKALIIMGTAGVFFLAIHWVLLASGVSLTIRLIVNVISIAVCGTAAVNFFRVALRASAEDAKRNPKPW